MGVGSEQCFPTEATATPEGPEQMSLPPSCSARCATPSRRWHATDYRYVGGRYGGCSEAQMMHEIYKHGPVVAGFEASAALYSHRGDAIYSSSSSGATAQTQDALASAGSIDTAGSSTLDDPRRRQVGMVEDEPLPFNLLRGVRNPGGRSNGDVEDATTRADDGTRSSKAAGVRSPGGGAHSFFERTNHAVLVVGWGVEPDGRKYWWAQNTWGSEWGLVGYFKMARGSDDSAFESMAVAIDVDGALPMMLEQPRSGDDVDEDVFLSGEGRRQAALQRRSRRRQNAHVALTPEHAPPPTPSPRFARIEEPREHFGPWAGGSDAAGAGAHHHSMLDSLAHWLYGGS